MNPFAPGLYRNMTCGSAAVLITLFLSAAFVESTAAAPGSRSAVACAPALQPAYAWFGQPEPAVLVD